MSTFTTLRDKLEHMLSVLFGHVQPIAEQVAITTGEAVIAAAASGTAHGSDEMIAVAKASLNAQLPELKNEALTAAAAVVADFHNEQAAAAAPVAAAPAATTSGG